MPDARRIARAYYTIAGVYTLSASLIWGINPLFLLRVGGLTLMQVFLANAVFTGSMAVFEVPTGVIADTAGRRLSFLLSVSVLFAGTAAYVLVPRLGGGFGAFCAVSVVLGLGYTFYSGAVEAWVVDALRATGDEGPVDRVMARGASISSVMMLVGTVAGGLLGGISLSLPYIIRCVLLAGAFVIALVQMHDVGFVTRELRLAEAPAEMRRIARDGIRFGWNVPHARLAILAGAMPAIFLEWGYHAWQPYFLQLLGTTMVWVTGTIAAAVALAMAGCNAVVERLTAYCGRRTTILIGAAAVYSVASVGVGLAPAFPLAVLLYLISMMGAGIFQPVRQGYLHLAVASEQRATVLSLASLVASLGSMAGQAGLGWLSARESLRSGYVAGGLATALALVFLVAMRRLGGVPDRIVGKAGRYSACSPLSLPEGVSVGATRDVALTLQGPPQ